MNLREAIESLVFRARMGDQNAMGTIATVAEEAKKDNRLQAKVAFRMLEEYIQAHPAGGKRKKIAFFGQDTLPEKYPKEWTIELLKPETFFNAFQKFLRIDRGPALMCVVLAHGPSLTLKNVAGYVDKLPQNQEAKAEAGKVLSQARRVQAIWDPRCPLKVLCPMVAWELE